MNRRRGAQTAEFMDRLERNMRILPPILVQLSKIMRERVEIQEEPGEAEVQALLGDLGRYVASHASRAELSNTCGEQGEWCGRCPFGVFIPQEFEFSSETQPICLPWIAVTRFGSLN
ncbi:MAG: hypothetical protein D6791_06765 [Chloroflexi bacterium]|nr:MAG: hypothetical protein D6791_06765 [Chloroflexota bacterium]